MALLVPLLLPSWGLVLLPLVLKGLAGSGPRKLLSVRRKALLLALPCTPEARRMRCGGLKVIGPLAVLLAVTSMGEARLPPLLPLLPPSLLPALMTWAANKSAWRRLMAWLMGPLMRLSRSGSEARPAMSLLQLPRPA